MALGAVHRCAIRPWPATELVSLVVREGLLGAGRSRLRFGAGELIVRSRATNPGAAFDIGEIALDAARAFLRKNNRSDLGKIPIAAQVREGNPSLQ